MSKGNRYVLGENQGKYQTGSRGGGSGDQIGSKVQDVWRKVEWALCRKEDLAKFKTDLVAHTESIEILLMTVQIGATKIENRRSTDSHKTLAGRLQESYVACMGKLSVILGSVTTGIEQGRPLLEMTEGIIKTNVQIFQIVLDLQNFITRIPNQAERQQPVYFVDALGRHPSNSTWNLYCLRRLLPRFSSRTLNIFNPAYERSKVGNLLFKPPERNEI